MRIGSCRASRLDVGSGIIEKADEGFRIGSPPLSIVAGPIT